MTPAQKILAAIISIIGVAVIARGTYRLWSTFATMPGIDTVIVIAIVIGVTLPMWLVYRAICANMDPVLREKIEVFMRTVGIIQRG
jgi:hypothetical protein